ncbi:MAG: putative metal-binding motif-containing protein, partial [Deltaproteobacteria bacterium]|nr:putative metal-binding motif-containing protein [Deltaproteobacteria bacterium]
AVGSGTTVDHVQVHMSKDDCIEFFGGTVSLKYAIASACGDDSFDWTDGWRGNAQFVVVQQKGDEADRGIEADNYEFGQDNLPRSNPTLYNMTLVGDPSPGSTSNRGMTIRRGTAGNIRNSIIMGFATNAGCDIDDDATFAQATAGNLIIDNNIFYNNLTSFATDSAAFLGTTMQNNQTRNPLLNLPYDQSAPDFRPNTESPALDNDTVPVAAPPAGNSYIISTDYIGAVDPDNDWTRAAWTSYGEAAWTPDDCTDADLDSYSLEGGDCGAIDCNDGNAAINPGANETCADGVDNDCDGQVDEGCDNDTCTDADNDTYAVEGGDCGAVDCNDGNAAINPGANETCEDGVDNDCDGQVDEGCDNATECVMTVRPATVYKFLSRVFPLRVYSLQGDGNAAFTSGDELDWGTPGITTLSARLTGRDTIRGIIFVRPRFLEAGTYDVTAGNCVGTIEIK